MDFLALDPLLKEALREDLGRGDITTDSILEGMSLKSDRALAQANVVAKEAFVLAGWPVFVRMFELLGGIETQSRFGEGDRVSPGVIGTLRGEAAVLLKGERVALNFLQRLSGVATRTRTFVDLVAHTKARILDTRKTTPLWRSLEKYAVRVGGGINHRFGLDDGILIKENHIAVAGGIRPAIDACRRHCSHLQRIEIEVQNLDQLAQALEVAADAVLLDNMPPHQVHQAVKLAKGRCLLEVSGGVNKDNIIRYAETGVDFISLGTLTHSYTAVDISLLLDGLSLKM